MGFAVLVLRRPEVLTISEFYADDSAHYTEAWQAGAATLIDPRGGSLLTIQRLLTFPQLWVPPPAAPFVSNATALIIAALVAAFLASDRIPAPPVTRLVLALGFVLLPTSYEMFGTMSHIQWVTGAWLISLLIARPGPRWELPLIALAALEGPIVVFLAPLFLVRWWLRKEAPELTLVILVCALVQTLALVLTISSDRPGVTDLDVGLMPLVIVTRTMNASLPYALALLGFVLIATAEMPWWVRSMGAGLALALPAAGLIEAHAPTRVFLDMFSAQRYFWLSTAILAGGVLLARPRRISARGARWLALAGFAVMFVNGFAIKPIPSVGWASASLCIGGPAPCEVPVAPSDYWTIVWPGTRDDGTPSAPWTDGDGPQSRGTSTGR